VSVTAGRQRIAWGVAHFWSPADFFNPITPLIVDRDFRQGVDAAQMEWTGNGGWRWTGLYAPAAKQGPHARYGLRIETPSTGRDVGIFAVRSGDDWTGGASFAGQLKGAGIRGEGTFRWSAAPLQPNAFRFAAGADYAFRGNLYLDTEYFYNQGQPPGSAGPSGTALPSSTTEIVTGRRHFLSAGLKDAITPLFETSAFVVADLAGRGLFFNPGVSYNLGANLDLAAGAQIFAAKATSDFRNVPALFYTELFLHF
jgi:hypothetical protein